MLASTMNNLKRKTQNSPQRVISPQSRSVNVGFDKTRIIANNNNIQVANQLRKHTYSSLPRSVAVSPNARQFQSVGYLSNRNRLDNSPHEIITFNRIPQYHLPSSSNKHSVQIEDNSIIQGINSRPINLNQNSLQIQNDNIVILNSLPSQESQLHSKLLAEQFKTNLQTFEKKKFQQISEQKYQSLTKPDNSQYIIQLLSQSIKTKEMIERLINDNESLIKQNNNLLKAKQEYEQLKIDNNILKQYLKTAINKQEIVSIQKQTEIMILKQQIAQLQKLITINMQQKVIQTTQNEINQLKTYNNDLTQKIKQLLTELNRFDHERMIMIEQNDKFKLYATQQIQRLTSILHSYQLSQNQQQLQQKVNQQQTIRFQQSPILTTLYK